jgi:hypothetical protein
MSFPLASLGRRLALSTESSVAAQERDAAMETGDSKRKE